MDACKKIEGARCEVIGAARNLLETMQEGWEEDVIGRAASRLQESFDRLDALREVEFRLRGRRSAMEARA